MKFNEEQIDAFREMINIGVGKAGASLSELIDDRIELKVPQVQIWEQNDVEQKSSEMTEEDSLLVIQSFQGGVSGRSGLIFPRSSGIKLASLLLGEELGEEELDTELEGVILEIGNIVLNGVLGTVSNMIDAGLQYQVPELSGESIVSLLPQAKESKGATQYILMADAKFSVASRDINGSIMIMFEIGGIEYILDQLGLAA